MALKEHLAVADSMAARINLMPPEPELSEDEKNVLVLVREQLHWISQKTSTNKRFICPDLSTDIGARADCADANDTE